MASSLVRVENSDTYSDGYDCFDDDDDYDEEEKEEKEEEEEEDEQVGVVDGKLVGVVGSEEEEGAYDELPI